MGKPTLQELLKKHNDEDDNRQDNGVTPRQFEQENKPSSKTRRLRSLFIELPSNKRFTLQSGNEVSNLMELYEEVLSMPDDVFYNHVNAYKNDFADWVQNTLQEPSIAARLSETSNKDEFIYTLAEEIKYLEDDAYKRKAMVNPEKRYNVQKEFQPQPYQNTQHLEKIEENSKELRNLNQMIYNLAATIENIDNRVSYLTRKMESLEKEHKESISRLSEKMEERHQHLQKELNELEKLENEVEWRRRHVSIMEKSLSEQEKQIDKNE
ncbi:MAG: hypothetical protein ACOCZQ_02075 [Nanoarchaeota archaeon]